MPTDQDLTLFYAPQTRSTGTRVLLEDLGAPHKLHVINFKQGEHREPAYLAVNPMGKVPAVLHGNALITEQGAITAYLADLFPEAGLAPGTTDPLRGPYLRWLFFYGSCLEPAVVDRYMQRETGPKAMSPYGSYDDVIGTIMSQLEAGPWLFGERFTAADVLWGTALTWLTGFKLVPEEPAIKSYVKRFGERPSVAKVNADDARLAAEHAAAAKGQ